MAKLREAFNSYLKEAETWKTEKVLIEVFKKNDDKEFVRVGLVDVCDHIGCHTNDPSEMQPHGRRFQSKLQKNEMEKFYLSERFDSATKQGRQDVANHIINLFDGAGGGIVMTGSSSVKKKDVILRCFRHKKAKVNKEKNADSRSTSTVRPQQHEDTCNFRFVLYYEDAPSVSNPSAVRYFFYKEGGGNRFHNGHLPKKQDEIMKRASRLDKNELEIANDGMGVNLSSQSMSVLMKGRIGLAVDPKKLRNFHMRSQQSDLKSKDSANLTAAEELLRNLASNKSVSAVYLVAQVEVGKGLITTYVNGKKKAKKDLKISFVSNVVNGCMDAESSTQSSTQHPIDPTTLSSDGIDTPKQTAEDIYNSLEINGDTEILLCVAWCTDKQRRLLGLFPEALTTDVLFKTNNEKRPMKHVCGKTSSNETFGGLYAFLPSQARWVFDYIWSVAVPSLADPRVLRRNQLMSTDGDQHMYNAFVQQIPSFYPNSHHRLCTFHLITQGWPQNLITSKRVKQGPGSQVGITILESIKNWVLGWTNDVISPEELNVSYEILMYFLKEEEFMRHFDDNFPRDVMTFLQTKVWPYREKFAYYHFMSRRHFGMRTTNPSEIEGGVLKHHGAGPKPNHSLAKSAGGVCEVSDLRITLKEQKAAKAVDSMPVVIKPSLAPLYKSVTRYCADTVHDIWNRRETLAVFRESDDTFYVKRNSFALPQQAPPQSNHKEYEKYLRPRFERTCVVKVCNVGGKLYLKCSCREREQYGYNCEDIFAVVDAPPDPNDIDIRWHKPYYAAYLNGDHEFDRLIDNIVENELPWMCLSCESLEDFRTDLAVGDCTSEQHTNEYFKSTLPSKPPKIHPGSMWSTRAPYSMNNELSSVDTERVSNAAHNSGGTLTASSSMQTVVALSQTAATANSQYSQYLDQFDGGGYSDDDDDKILAVDAGNNGNDESVMDTSMATYSSKSPDRAASDDRERFETTRLALKHTSFMSLCKPQMDMIANTVGSDTKLTMAFQDTLSEFLSYAMAEKRKNNKKSHGVSSGIQSLPAIDKATKSIRVEQCPTGNHAAGGKKRVARKPPPTA